MKIHGMKQTPGVEAPLMVWVKPTCLKPEVTLRPGMSLVPPPVLG